MAARRQWHSYPVAFDQSEPDSLIYSHECLTRGSLIFNISQSNFQIPVIFSSMVKLRKSLIPHLLTLLIERLSNQIHSLDFFP